MTHNITWRRTVIGREPIHHDFSAEVDGVTIARIRRLEYGELKNRWEYNFQLGHSGFRGGADNGHADNRNEAIAAIKARFVAFIATPDADGGVRHDGFRAVMRDFPDWHLGAKKWHTYTSARWCKLISKTQNIEATFMQKRILRQACPHCHVTYLDLPKDFSSDLPIRCSSCGEVVGNWSEIERAFNASGLQSGVFRFEDGVIIRIDVDS